MCDVFWKDVIRSVQPRQGINNRLKKLFPQSLASCASELTGVTSRAWATHGQGHHRKHNPAREQALKAASLGGSDT